jgi:Secretion system C-terminal sorting domain
VSMLTIASSQQVDLSVSVFNELGQVMTQVRAENASQVQLNVSGLAAGVYFVRVSGTGWVETKKIVVKH